MPQGAQGGARDQSRSNIVELEASSTIADLLKAFEAAGGDPKAPLRGGQEGGRTWIVIPKSPDAVPSIWTRFKAALSDLPLFNRSAALRAARLEVRAVALEQHQGPGNVLRTGILTAIRQEVGNDYVNVAAQSMDAKAKDGKAKPLTKRRVEKVLGNANNVVSMQTQCRKWDADWLRSDHSVPERTSLPRARLNPLPEALLHPLPEAPLHPLPEVPLNPPLQASRDPAAVGGAKAPAKKAKREPALDEALQPFKLGRHERLLNHCADLIGKRHAGTSMTAIAVSARELHDRIKVFLETSGQWPIKDDDAFEEDIKPVADIMAASDV